MLEDLYISLPNENIRKEVLKEWAALAPGEDFGILPGLTADYLMMTDGRGIRGLKPVMLLMCGDHGDPADDQRVWSGHGRRQCDGPSCRCGYRCGGRRDEF